MRLMFILSKNCSHLFRLLVAHRYLLYRPRFLPTSSARAKQYGFGKQFGITEGQITEGQGQTTEGQNVKFMD